MEFLEVKGVKKSFREKGLFGLRGSEREVLKGITFSVTREIFGFIGPNGAGKTTTIKVILNFIKPDCGEVFILGRRNSDVSVRGRIGFLPERPYVYTSITGKEYLDFCADVYRIPFFERRRLFKRLLELVDLLGAEERPISSYSKGMVQRLLFASTLVNDPDLLILDEPMSGLDPVGRSTIASVMRELKERGKAIFYSSHIIQDVERLSDRVAIIVDGRIKLLDSVAGIVQRFLRGYTVTARKPGSGRLETFKVETEKVWPFLVELKERGYELISVEPERLSLEEILVSYVGKSAVR